VSIPLWLLLLAIVGVIVVVFQVRRSAARMLTIDVTPPAAVLQPEPQLSDLEVMVVRALATLDGASMGHHELVGSLGVSRLLVEQALDRLDSYHHFLRVTDKPMGGTFIQLSASGRDFAIRQGYVPTEPPVPARPAYFQPRQR